MTHKDANAVADRLRADPQVSADWMCLARRVGPLDYVVYCERRESRFHVLLTGTCTPDEALLVLEDAWDQFMGSQP